MPTWLTRSVTARLLVSLTLAYLLTALWVALNLAAAVPMGFLVAFYVAFDRQRGFFEPSPAHGPAFWLLYWSLVGIVFFALSRGWRWFPPRKR